MRFHVLTLFPEMIENALSTSIIGKAKEKALINLNLINIRDFTENKHKKVDDYPYGGGAGMVMQPQPIISAYESIKPKENQRVIYLSPQGRPFNQEIAKELAKEEELVFLCGHYEGVDERVIEEIVTDEISIGDYVLTGGELAAMVMIDCISRLIEGVLNNETSAEIESFDDGLLEYPQYTRPPEYNNKKVPDVLLSGHHKNIEEWRREQSIIRTIKKRPDLIEGANLTEKERRFANGILSKQD